MKGCPLISSTCTMAGAMWLSGCISSSYLSVTNVESQQVGPQGLKSDFPNLEDPHVSRA